MSILEIGCGDGSFWTTNEDKLPGHLSVTLTDISEGMLRDARRNLMSCSNRDFTYVVADAAICHLQITGLISYLPTMCYSI